MSGHSAGGYYRRGHRDSYSDRSYRDRSPVGFDGEERGDRGYYRRDNKRRSPSPDYYYRRDADREEYGYNGDRNSGSSNNRGSPHSYRSRDEEDVDNSPTATMVIKGLPFSCDEGTVWGIIGEQGYKPKDIRILRRRETGQSRGFGFVEFGTVEEATAWMDHTQGYLKVDEKHTAELQYSTNKAPPGGFGPDRVEYERKYVGDWLCSECGTNNFKKRDQCFKCGITREDSEQLGSSKEGYAEIGMVPCETILLRNLPKHANEDRVLAGIRRVAGADPEKIVIARDPVTQLSRGFAYVQMRSLPEAMQVLTTLTAITRLNIDGRDVMVSYSRTPITQVSANIVEAAAKVAAFGGQLVGDAGPAPAQHSRNQLQADNANAAAAVAQNAIRKAQAVKQVQNAVLHEQLGAAAQMQVAHAQAQALQQVQAQAAAAQAMHSQSSMASLGLIPTAVSFSPSHTGATLLIPTVSSGIRFPGNAAIFAGSRMTSQSVGFPLITSSQAVDSHLAAQAHAQILQIQQQKLQAQLQQMQAAEQVAAIAQQQQLKQQLAAIVAAQAEEQAALIAVAEEQAAADGLAASADAAMSGDAVASTGASEAADLGNVETPYGELPRYPYPDTSQYQYEETSGLYYDPSTGLYYDSNTQYYYNGDTQQYLYWDASYETYLPAPTGTEEDGEAGAAGCSEKPKKEKEKQEKVKMAKKVQKDMEKWAKAQNQRKERAKAGFANALDDSPSISKQSATADAAFLALEQQAGIAARQPPPSLVAYDTGDSDDEGAGSNNPSATASTSAGGDAGPPPSVPTFAVPGAPVGMSSISTPAGLVRESEKYADWTKMACLLCRRAFPNKEALIRHQQLSDLHKQNLETKMKSVFAAPAEPEPTPSQMQYRDRAKERREKFGSEHTPRKNKLKEQYLEAKKGSYEVIPSSSTIGANNIGNKMLSKMGWQEGTGLGRTQQGMVDPIQAERHMAGVGLGATPGRVGGGDMSVAAQQQQAKSMFDS